MDYFYDKNSNLTTHDEKSLRLLSINKASKILGIRFDNVLKLIKSEKIKFIKIGRRIKIPYLNLIKFIDEQSERYNSDFINISTEEEISKKIDEIISKYSRVGLN